jgi:hypothetical protein
MKYPCVVPKSVCKTPVRIEIEQEGISVYGEPLAAVSVDTKCNYQDKAKTILTKEKKEVVITGCVLIPGDLAPELPTISGGTVIIFGEQRRIATGTKARNPDGTVNYTRLDLE